MRYNLTRRCAYAHGHSSTNSGRVRQDAEGFFDGPPDLAVEVVSPNDRAPEVEQKVQDFLSAGSQQVWIVHPSTQTVTIYYANHSATVLTANDNIEGGALLPNFTLPLAEIFK